MRDGVEAEELESHRVEHDRQGSVELDHDAAGVPGAGKRAEDLCRRMGPQEIVVVVVEAVAQRFAMDEPGRAAGEREEQECGERPTSPGSAWQSFAAAGWTCPRRFADLGVAEQLLDRNAP